MSLPEILSIDPFQNPPSFEKLIGDLPGALVLDERFMWGLSQKYVSELSIAPGFSDDVLETYSGGTVKKCSWAAG